MDVKEKEEEIILGLFGVKGVGKKTIINWCKEKLEAIPYSQKTNETSTAVLFKFEYGKQVNLFLYSESYNDNYPNLTIELMKNYYKNIIFVIDLTNTKSFEIVKYLIKELRQTQSIFENKNIVIFSNKFDLVKERKIKKTEVETYAKENEIEFFVTNSKTGFQLNDGLSYIVDLALKKNNNKEIDKNKEKEESEEYEEYEEEVEIEDSEKIDKINKFKKDEKTGKKFLKKIFKCKCC